MNVHVKDGTNAGWRRVIDPSIAKCPCGGFISQARAEQGATQCLLCEKGL